MKAQLHKGRIHLSYSPSNTMNKRIRGLFCLMYRKKKGVPHDFNVSNVPSNIEKLEQWGFELDPRLRIIHSRRERKRKKIVSDIRQKIPAIVDRLFPFQLQGVAFVESRNGRALIGDEMRLGKSIQSIAWLAYKRKQALPVVIVCPSTAKYPWVDEFESWLPGLKIHLAEGRSNPIPMDSDIVIINYDILTDNLEALLEFNARTLILDEIHYVKNNQAARTAAVKVLAKPAQYLLGLSGTPLINRPIEFFNALRLIDPATFKSYWRFAHSFCEPKHNEFGWNFKGSANEKELHQLLNDTVMIRRLKKDYMPQLKKLPPTIIPIDIDNREEYNFADKHFLDWLQDKEGELAVRRARKALSLVKREKLRGLCSQGKLAEIIRWIDNFLESENKLVVFGVHKIVVKTLYEKYKKIAVKVDGDSNKKERIDSIKDFKSKKKVKLFIANIQSAAHGLDLSVAHNLVVVEFGWTPAEFDQAAARLDHFEQDKLVNIYCLLARNTIEEDNLELIDNKRTIIGKVVDGN